MMARFSQRNAVLPSSMFCRFRTGSNWRWASDDGHSVGHACPALPVRAVSASLMQPCDGISGLTPDWQARDSDGVMVQTQSSENKQTDPVEPENLTQFLRLVVQRMGSTSPRLPAHAIPLTSKPMNSTDTGYERVSTDQRPGPKNTARIARWQLGFLAAYGGAYASYYLCASTSRWRSTHLKEFPDGPTRRLARSARPTALFYAFGQIINGTLCQRSGRG